MKKPGLQNCRRLMLAVGLSALAAGFLLGCPRERAEDQVQRGRAFLKLQDNPQALEAFQRAVRLDPRLGPAFDGLAISYCRLGRVEEGRQAVARAESLDPSYPGYPLTRGMCEESRGAPGFEAALNAYERAGLLDPKNADIQFQIGSALQRLGRHRDALPHFQRAIELNPKLFVAYNNLGVSLAALGEFEQAVRLYQQAIRIHPELAGLSFYTNLGIAFLYQNNLPRAEAAFTLETAINPDQLEAHLNLGNIYAIQGRVEEAIQEYRRVLRLEPKNRQARINLAIVEISQNRPGPAQEVLLKLLEDYPRDPAGHYYLGKTYSLLGDRGRADRELEQARALGFKPEFPSSPPPP